MLIELIARRWSFRAAAAAAAAMIGSSVLAPAPAEAATTYQQVALTASVAGADVTVSTTVRASVGTTAELFGVCVRDDRDTDRDLDFDTSVRISSSGTSFTRSASFAAGTYTFFSCVRVNGDWTNVGAVKTFTVSAATADEGATTTWRNTYSTDFDASVGRGGLLTSSAYSPYLYGYSGYNDTSGNGRYDPNSVLSATDGALDWYIHSEDGQHKVAAVVPHPAGGWGQTYGRYTVRFRSDILPGYKLAFMLWPDSDNWGEGEVDFPEVGELVKGNSVYANLYQRKAGSSSPGPSVGFSTDVDAAGSGWHTARIEWSPNRLTYILDGDTLGTLTSGVPNTNFHLVLQVETAVQGGAPASSVAGHVQVDAVSIDRYAG